MFTVSVSTQDVKTATLLLNTLEKLSAKNVEVEVSDSETSKATKRGRPAKAEASQMDLTFGDEEETEDEVEEETVSSTSPKDVIAALQAYSTKHTREKAKALVPKICAKYAVKSVNDLSPDQCDEVLATLAKK